MFCSLVSVTLSYENVMAVCSLVGNTSVILPGMGVLSTICFYVLAADT